MIILYQRGLLHFQITNQRNNKIKNYEQPKLFMNVLYVFYYISHNFFCGSYSTRKYKIQRDGILKGGKEKGAPLEPNCSPLALVRVCTCGNQLKFCLRFVFIFFSLCFPCVPALQGSPFHFLKEDERKKVLPYNRIEKNYQTFFFFLK